jgi:hypothetical protein
VAVHDVVEQPVEQVADAVHDQVRAVVPPLDQAVDVEAVVLADGDEGLGGDEGGELAADQLRRRPVEPHGVGGEEQVIGVAVQFGPLMALDGVLDRERVQPELLGQDGQVSVVGVVQVEPDRHPLLPEELTDLGAVTVAAAPPGVGGPTQYGPSLRALAVYLLVFQHVPVARTAQLIADLTGARPSTGWVTTALTEAAAALVEVEKLIQSLIVLAHVVHVDETSVSINGARWWLHVAGTDRLTAYHLHRSRGRAAVNEFGVLPGYRGVAVHDALSVYDAYPDADHALCGAHLARELTAAAEAHPDGEALDLQRSVAVEPRTRFPRVGCCAHSEVAACPRGVMSVPGQLRRRVSRSPESDR